MIRGFLLCMSLVTFTLSTADAETVQTLSGGKLAVTIPDGYEAFDIRALDPNDYAPGQNPHAGTSWFVRRGGRAALAQELPNYDTDHGPFNGELRQDMRAYAILRVVELIPTDREGARDHDDGFWVPVPEGSSAQEIHDLFCSAFSAQWGEEFTFDLYDAETGIGRCINYVGAFIAVFTRKVGKSLVVVEAKDLVRILVMFTKTQSEMPSKHGFSEMSESQKWEFFGSAANAKAAEQILLSARLLP